MTERWRKPARILNIEAAEHGLWLPDGRVHGEVQLTCDAETIERMRAGYLCAKCLEPFEQAWPERCHVCGAPIRKEQAAYFAREFGGEEQPEPRLSLDEEIELMHEEVAKEKEKER